MHVLGIPGSLRRESYNRRLLEVAASRAPAGMEVTLAPQEVVASVPPFNEDLEALPGGDPEPVRDLRDRVRAADGLLIATPEYNQSIPGVMKNLLDWLSRRRPDEVLVGKPVAIFGATPGEWGTRLSQGMLRQVLGSTEALVLPAGTSLYVRHVDRLFDETGELRDAETLERIDALLEALAAWIERCGRQWEPTRLVSGLDRK